MPTSIKTPTASLRVEKRMTVRNEHGLHARPATDFVRCALRFQSAIHLRIGDQRFSAKRVVEVLFANLSAGADFVLEAEGADAAQAAETLERLLAHFAAQDLAAREFGLAGTRGQRDIFLD